MNDVAEIIDLTAEIVASYVENNSLATADVPALIQSVHRALTSIATGVETVEVKPKEPAVPVRKSITPDHLVCLEDGRTFKSLKRHLRTKYNLSPEDYRAKWAWPRTTRWSPRTTPRLAPTWPSRWAWDRAGGRRRRPPSAGRAGRRPRRGAPAIRGARSGEVRHQAAFQLT